MLYCILKLCSMSFIGTFVLSTGFKICALLNEIKIRTVSYVQYHSLI